MCRSQPVWLPPLVPYHEARTCRSGERSLRDISIEVAGTMRFIIDFAFLSLGAAMRRNTALIRVETCQGKKEGPAQWPGPGLQNVALPRLRPIPVVNLFLGLILG